MYGITAMSKPTNNINLGDRSERLFDSFHQRFNRSRLGFPQKGLEFRPAILNRIEIRRVGRQKDQTRPARRDQLFQTSDLVRFEVIPDHHVTGLQGRAERLAHPGAKNFSIDSALNHTGCRETLQTQRRQQDVIAAVIFWHRFDDPLTGSRAAITAGQLQSHPGFINKVQPRRCQLAYFFSKFGAQLFDPRGVAFSGVGRLFFNGRLSRCNSRQMVAPETAGALALRRRWRNSSRVASGCCSTSCRNNSAWSCKRRETPPAWGLAALCPVVRQRFQSFSTNDKLTPKFSAISGCVSSPASRVWVIRSRRS